LNDGEIICGNNELAVSPLEAVNLVKGVTTKSEEAQKAFSETKANTGHPKSKRGKKALAWGSDHPDVKGMMPVRRSELLPTDKDEISRFNVSTAHSNPHIALPVFKGSGYGAAVQVFVKKIKTAWGATLLRIGFDWKSNALWIKKDSEKEAQMIANANCISDFTLSEHKSVRQSRVHFDQDYTKLGTRVQHTDKSWMLLAKMSNDTNKLVFVFDEKKEGEAALDKLLNLLRQQ